MTTYYAYADISRAIGVPINTLRQWRLRGKLPPPDYNPNPRVVLWERATIEEWMNERVANAG